MQNIYTDTRPLDKAALKAFSLTDDILMENAAVALGQAVLFALSEQIDNASNTDRLDVLIITGSGDNGGDGMALARRLVGSFVNGRKLRLAVYPAKNAKSEACKRQTERAQKANVQFCKSLDETGECCVLVDCLFGSGFHGRLDDASKILIDRINKMNCIKIVCDIPSGIDGNGIVGEMAVLADVTVTMGALKTGLYSDAAKIYVGNIICAPLGISHSLFENSVQIAESTYGDNTPVSSVQSDAVIELACKPTALLLDESDLALPHRTNKSVHKGNFGHAAIIAGEKQGAALLAASAAFRFGAGLVTLVHPKNNPIANCPLELMQSQTFPQKTDAIALGMGLGGENCLRASRWLCENPDIPCVLDADMFYFEGLAELLFTRADKTNTVLTPHPKEFLSLLTLCGIDDESKTLTIQDVADNRLKLVRMFRQKYPKVVLLLKGANVIIACGEKLYINPHGKPCLAKAGSGDVLAGLICALLAQGYNPLEAAIQGSLAHALASHLIKVDYAMTPFSLIEAVTELGRKKNIL